MTGLLTTLQALPQADPLPLPALPWIFFFLLYLTLTIHFIAMSTTIGGTIMLAASSFARSDNMDKLSGFLAKILPVTLSFTVTFGVAPLLFIQVLYGQLFFTTSILMGWWWLMILAFLMIAYYGLYLYQHKRDAYPAIRTWMPLVSAVLMAIVALLFVMNFKLFYRFAEWKDIYLSGAGGWFLNFGQPQVWPSWIHHMLSSVALGGFLVVLHGWARRGSDRPYGEWALRTGGILFVVPTLLQFAVGYWMLLALPRELLRAFMFRSAYETGILFAGMGFGTLAALLVAWAAWRRRFGWPVALSAVLIAATTALMVLKRAAVREFLLRPLQGFDIGAMQVVPQWDTIAIFGVLLVAGLAAVAWMLYVLVHGKGEAGKAA